MNKNGIAKKILALALALVFVLAIAACGSKETTSSGTTEKTETTGTTEKTEPAPAATEAKAPELSYWIKMDATKISPTTDNFGTILCYQEMAKITGVNVTFIHPPAGQENDSFSLMLTGGEYPDLIHWDWGHVSGGPDKMIEEGVILDLAQIIDEKCPNLKAFLDEHPEIRAAMTTDDGHIYCFPNVYPYFEEDTIIVANRGYQVRQDWLKELGLKEPETIDDWYTMLKAFKEKGTAENGGEIVPMVSQQLSSKTSMIRTLANAWGGLDYDFYVDNGVVKYGPTQPTFKDYLTTMNQWYNEGLINKDFSTIDLKAVNAMITEGQAGAWFYGLGAGMGVYIKAFGDESKIEGVKFPVVNAGDTPKYTILDNYPFIGLGTAISTKCKDIDAACKWLDYHFNDEGRMLMNWGVQGVSYELDANGEPYFTDAVLHDPDGLSVDVALGKYAMVSQLDAIAKDHRSEALRMLTYDTQKEAAKVFNDADFTYRYPPTATMTAEESAEYASIMSDINTYRDENLVRFIVGTEPLENFEKFVSQIEKMNIARAIEIKQASYDRLQARMK